MSITDTVGLSFKREGHCGNTQDQISFHHLAGHPEETIDVYHTWATYL
jgi:hypothetical protein